MGDLENELTPLLVWARTPQKTGLTAAYFREALLLALFDRLLFFGRAC